MCEEERRVAIDVAVVASPAGRASIVEAMREAGAYERAWLRARVLQSLLAGGLGPLGWDHKLRLEQ